MAAMDSIAPSVLLAALACSSAAPVSLVCPASVWRQHCTQPLLQPASRTVGEAATGRWFGVPAVQLHTEYRSTYRWHEYTPKQDQQTVVNRPPQLASRSGIDGSDFSRKKKHPCIAYKSQLSNAMTTSSNMEQPGHQHQEQTNGSNNVRHPRPLARQALHPPCQGGQEGRRSQSEGPGTRQSEGPGTRNPLFQSEYRLQFAPSTGPGGTPSHQRKRGRGEGEGGDDGQAQEPKMNVSFPPPAPSSGWNRRQNSLRAKEMVDGGREPKKSISMGQIPPNGPAPGLVKEKHDINGNMDSAGEGGQTCSNKAESTKIREHKSEYKNRFRPFSQYEYIGDGKFHNTSTSPPNEIDNQAGGKFAYKPRQQLQDSSLTGEPWYQEVIELRKQANDYKQRGWGTDLVPPHMSQIYNQQINLHEQAARRESLSALALAISTPRTLNKDEKEKENLRKYSSPNKPRSSRPRTAPPKTLKKASVSRSESAHPSPTPGATRENSKDTSKEAKEHTKDGKPPTGRSVSAGSPGSRSTKSARDTPDQGREGWKVHLDTKEAAGGQTRAHSAKRQRPNHEVKERVEGGDNKKGVSRTSSKATSRDPSRPPSAIENNIDYFREPVVKSPPEPTRVKSPEQLLMRSPDPINWTVPLDTGKTFSVTQSVRDSDSARNSPMSDHSSHFDSVSGTAVNLGGQHSVNEKGALQHHKVSALAREAKELQGIPGQKKEDKSEKTSSVPEGQTPAQLDTTAELPSDSGGPPPNPSNNGSQEPSGANEVTADHSNQTSKVEKEKQDSTPTPSPIPIKPLTSGPIAAAAKVPGSNLKCLDDPNFSFDTAPSSSSISSVDKAATKPQPTTVSAAASGESKAGVEPKRPSYRVLEDPEVLGPIPRGSPYKVLEDPMTASLYQQEPLGQSGPQ